MISLEKLKIKPLQKLPKIVGDLGKLIIAKGFKKLPKVQKIAQSGHTKYKQPKMLPCMQRGQYAYQCSELYLSRRSSLPIEPFWPT